MAKIVVRNGGLSLGQLLGRITRETESVKGEETEDAPRALAPEKSFAGRGENRAEIGTETETVSATEAVPGTEDAGLPPLASSASTVPARRVREDCWNPRDQLEGDRHLRIDEGLLSFISFPLGFFFFKRMMSNRPRSRSVDKRREGRREREQVVERDRDRRGPRDRSRDRDRVRRPSPERDRRPGPAKRSARSASRSSSRSSSSSSSRSSAHRPRGRRSRSSSSRSSSRSSSASSRSSRSSSKASRSHSPAPAATTA
jgi:hypothetical protein